MDEIVRNTWTNCPLCGAGIKRACLKYGKPFPCPACRRSLVAPLHPGMAALVGGAAFGLLAYALGARGTWLVVATCLLLLPGLMASAFVWTLFVPPSLRPLSSDSVAQAPRQATDYSEGDGGETTASHMQNRQTTSRK
jgi:hypothetical protein